MATIEEKWKSLFYKIVYVLRAWHPLILILRQLRRLKHNETKISLDDGDHIIRIPAHLIYVHGRPLVCAHTFDIFKGAFSRKAIQNYMKWFDRVKSLDKTLWHRPELYPGKAAIIKCRRAALYLKFKLLCELGDSSPRNTIPAASFEHDRFTIADGHHRAAIWTAYGTKYIYLNCSDAIGKKWREREEKVRTVAASYRDYRMNTFKKAPYQPIETVVPNYEYTRNCYDRLALVLRPIGRDDETILDVGCNIGFFSRHMARMEKKVTSIDINSEHIETARKVASACGLQVSFREQAFQDIPDHERYDIVFDLTALWQSLIYSHKTMTEETLVKKLNGLCNNKLVSECSRDYLKQFKRLIMTGTHLKHYTPLGKVPYDNHYREIGVYSRKPWHDNNGEYDFKEWTDRERALWARRQRAAERLSIRRKK